MRFDTRFAAVGLAIALTATGCPPEKPAKPSKPAATQPTEDTRDETTLQFHEVGQLRYGRWYWAPDSNSACRWRIVTRPAGDDRPTVLERGDGTDQVRVRAEVQGRDVFLVFNRACGRFEER